MRLYLVQHGKAAEKTIASERPLTPEGAQEVDRIGTFLALHHVEIPEVWHSGKTRAQQTAERLAKHIARKAKVEARAGLAPKNEAADLVRTLRGHRTDLMIVGHLPFLSRLASSLLADDEDRDLVAFSNGGVVCLERDAENRWRVQWVLTPQILSG